MHEFELKCQGKRMSAFEAEAMELFCSLPKTHLLTLRDAG